VHARAKWKSDFPAGPETNYVAASKLYVVPQARNRGPSAGPADPLRCLESRNFDPLRRQVRRAGRDELK